MKCVTFQSVLACLYVCAVALDSSFLLQQTLNFSSDFLPSLVQFSLRILSVPRKRLGTHYTSQSRQMKVELSLLHHIYLGIWFWHHISEFSEQDYFSSKLHSPTWDSYLLQHAYVVCTLYSKINVSFHRVIEIRKIVPGRGMAAQHRGSILASQPAAPSSILSVPKDFSLDVAETYRRDGTA